jgi:hypothetical protein
LALINIIHKTTTFMKILILLFFLTISTRSFSQSIEREVIASGGEVSNPNLAWTLGEVMTETYSNPNQDVLLTQGFQQPTFPLYDILDIHLIKGWNTISSYIRPNNLNIMEILSDIADEVIILKDGEGNVVIPTLMIGGSLSWDVTQGYQMKVENDLILTIKGTKVEPTLTPVPIKEGWQIIGFLRDNPLNIPSNLPSINNFVIIMKDNAGNAFIPSLAINSINTLFPTQGYYLKSSANATMVYPQN